MTIDTPKKGPINLFVDEEFNSFIETLEEGVKFDNRKSITSNSLVTKIEANSLAYIDEIINEVDNVLLQEGMREKTREGQSIDKAKHEKLNKSVPILLKLLTYYLS